MDAKQEKEFAQALTSHEERIQKLEAGNLKEQSTGSLGELEAQLKEKANESAQFAEQITALEQENAALKERSDALDLFENLIRTPEGFVQIAHKFGYSAMIPPALEEEVAARATAGEGEAKQKVVTGKVDDPDYLFLPNMGVSILNDAPPTAAEEG